MIKATVIAVALGSAALSTADARATGGESGSRAAAMSPDALQEKVSRRLQAEPSLREDDIQVDVNAERVIRLSGSVDSNAEKQQATELARKASDGRRVDNLLIVLPAVYEDPRREAAQAVSETGEAIDDAWITTKVKTQLATGAPDATDINVDTRNNVVTLSGRVDSKAMKAQALSIARATEGVKRVQDNLVVSGK